MGGLEGFRNRVQSALICEDNKSKLSLLSQTYLNGDYTMFFILLILPSLLLNDNSALLNKKVPPYTMLVASGPERGKLHCYVCEQSEKEGVIVFTKKMSDGLSKVAGVIEKQSKVSPDFKGWVTLISEDSTQDAPLLKWANEHNLVGTPVGRFEYNPGPPAYRLSTDSVTEVFVFKAGKVLHSLKAKDEAEVEKLAAKLGDILKKAKS